MGWKSVVVRLGLATLGLIAIARDLPGAQIVAWGYSGNGLLNLPAPNEQFVDIYPGYDHCLARKQDGSLVAWGSNASGQCAIPSPNSGFLHASAGGSYSMAVREDHTLVGWGSNGNGTLTIPEPNGGFERVAAGTTYCVGLRADGSLAGWGTAGSGENALPAAEGGFVDVVTQGTAFMALRVDGSIVVWGGAAANMLSVPSPNAEFVSIALGSTHCLGLKSDGRVVAWGANMYGQCNVPPQGNGGIVDIAAGAEFSLILRLDGTMLAWGNNQFGDCTIPNPNRGCLGLCTNGRSSFALQQLNAPNRAFVPVDLCEAPLERWQIWGWGGAVGGADSSEALRGRSRLQATAHAAWTFCTYALDAGGYLDLSQASGLRFRLRTDCEMPFNLYEPGIALGNASGVRQYVPVQSLLDNSDGQWVTVELNFADTTNWTVTTNTLPNLSQVEFIRLTTFAFEQVYTVWIDDLELLPTGIASDCDESGVADWEEIQATSDLDQNGDLLLDICQCDIGAIPATNISLPCLVTGDTEGAQSWIGSPAGDRLYRFTLSQPTELFFNSCLPGTGFSTVGWLFRGSNPCDPSTQIASWGATPCADGERAASWESGILGPLAAGSYSLVLSGEGSEAGAFEFSLGAPQSHAFFAEDFEGGLGLFTAQELVPDSDPWIPAILDSARVGVAVGFQTDDGHDLAELVSPVFDCASNDVVLFRFWQDILLNDNDFWPQCDVLGSTDGGASWPITIAHWNGTDDNGSLHRVTGPEQFDLSSWAAGRDNIRVKFHFEDAIWDWWFIDDFQLLGTDAVFPGPVEVVIQRVGNGVRLSWTPSAVAIGYNIYRADRLGEVFQFVRQVADTSWVDPLISSDSQRFYHVCAASTIHVPVSQPHERERRPAGLVRLGRTAMP